MVAEPTAPRLLTLHNLAWVLAFMRRVRDAIAGAGLEHVRTEAAAAWDPEGA
jgi:queuine/archaeosine tRNA-ribosyltransferase